MIVEERANKSRDQYFFDMKTDEFGVEPTLAMSYTDGFIAGFDDTIERAKKWFIDNYGVFLAIHHNPINIDKFINDMNNN